MAGQSRPRPAPARAAVMKAVLCREPFSDPDWIYERKLDGIRCLAMRDGRSTRLLSRNDLDLGGRYPEIREAVAAQPAIRFAIDGENVRELALRARKRLLREAISWMTRCAGPAIATAMGRRCSPTRAGAAGRAWWPSGPTARTGTSARATG